MWATDSVAQHLEFAGVEETHVEHECLACARSKESGVAKLLEMPT